MTRRQRITKPRYDAKQFMQWALAQGSLRRAKAKLAAEADVSASMVEKLINGTYEGLPSADRRLRIAEVIGKPVAVLFPVTLEMSA